LSALGHFACAALLLATSAKAAEPTFAQRIDAAMHLYRKLDYEDALAQLDRAKLEAQTPSEDILVSLLRGVALAALGRDQESADAFLTALALNPDATVPLDLAPRVQQRLEELRGEVKAERARAGGASFAPPQPAWLPSPPPAMNGEAAPQRTWLRPAAWASFAASSLFIAGGAVAFARVAHDANQLVPSSGAPSTLSAPGAQRVRDEGALAQTLGTVSFCAAGATALAGAIALRASWGPGSAGIAVAGRWP